MDTRFPPAEPQPFGEVRPPVGLRIVSSRTQREVNAALARERLQRVEQARKLQQRVTWAAVILSTLITLYFAWQFLRSTIDAVLS